MPGRCDESQGAPRWRGDRGQVTHALACVAAGVVLSALATSCTSGPGTPRSPVSSSRTTPHHGTDPTGCSTAFTTLVSRAIGPVRVSSTSTDGLLTCAYHAGAQPVGRCSAARVTVNTAPQALTDFNRWVDEAVQNAVGPQREKLAPVLVPGVGVAADWVPATHTFETADDQRWVSVFLSCPDNAAGAFELARSLARAGLRR